MNKIEVKTFAAYVPWVLKTESSPGIFLDQLVPWFGDTPRMPAETRIQRFNEGLAETPELKLIRSQHATEGLCTEAGELMEAWVTGWPTVNVIEELGDLWWYVGVMADNYGWVRSVDDWLMHDTVKKGKRSGYVKALTINALALLDLHKKRKFYPREMSDDVVRMHLEIIVGYLAALCHKFGQDPYEVMAANARKLQARYGGSFSTDAANDRDTGNEMKALVNGSTVAVDPRAARELQKGVLSEVSVGFDLTQVERVQGQMTLGAVTHTYKRTRYRFPVGEEGAWYQGIQTMKNLEGTAFDDWEAEFLTRWEPYKFDHAALLAQAHNASSDEELAASPLVSEDGEAFLAANPNFGTGFVSRIYGRTRYRIPADMEETWQRGIRAMDEMMGEIVDEYEVDFLKDWEPYALPGQLAPDSDK